MDMADKWQTDTAGNGHRANSIQTTPVSVTKVKRKLHKERRLAQTVHNRIQAEASKGKQSKAKQSKASKAKQSKAKQSKARQGKARQSKAKQGSVRLNSADERGRRWGVWTASKRQSWQGSRGEAHAGKSAATRQQHAHPIQTPPLSPSPLKGRSTGSRDRCL